MTIKDYKFQTKQCGSCNLCETRHSVVFGEGSETPEVLFIGEFPGADENIQGVPFIGFTGRKLREIMNTVNINHSKIFITYLVKCRPQGYKPTLNKENIKICKQILDKQIELLNPKLIVCIGLKAANGLLGLDKDMGTLSKTAWNYNGRSVFVVYSPAALEYKQQLLSKIIEQFNEIAEFINGENKIVEKKDLTETKEPEWKGYKLIEDINTAQSVLTEFLSTSKIIAFDTETTGLDYETNEIIGFSICCYQNEGFKAFYFPIRHRFYENLNWEELKPLVKQILESNDIRKIFHHAKFDIRMLQNEGINTVNFDDTLLLAYSIDENMLNYQLKTLGTLFVESGANFYEEELKKIKRKIGIDDKEELDKFTSPNYSDINPKQIYKYACYDVYLTFNLFIKLDQKLLQDTKKYGEEYKEFVIKTYIKELCLCPVLIDMEKEGLTIDVIYLANINGELLYKMVGIKRRMTEIVGHKIDINSNVAISKILQADLHFNIVKLTKKENIIVDDGTLVEFYDCEFTRLLREYRTYRKLVSTYILPSLVKSKNGILHTTFNQHRTTNGRLSSSDPNLQNLPKHIKTSVGINEGDLYRKGLINSGDDYYTIFADYSQIELRIGAHYAKVQKLIDAYNNKKDIHRLTAELMYRKKEISKEERDNGKITNLLKQYGGGLRPIINHLAKHNINIPQEYTIRTYAEFISGAWNKAYPEVAQFSKYCENIAIKRGYVKNHFKRVRRLNNITAWLAFQFIISSTAADIMKEAMIKIHKYLKTKKSKIILQIHDELILKVHKTEIYNTLDMLQKIMTFKELKIECPINIEVSTINWIEKKQVKEQLIGWTNINKEISYKTDQKRLRDWERKQELIEDDYEQRLYNWKRLN